MATDFASESFLTLTKKEKKELVIKEFSACRNDFEYYLDNYAQVRHPNVGVIPMRAFDFQKDVSLPIAQTLKHRRSEESIKALQRYKHKFDYDKWWNKIAEEKIELSKVIPPEFHKFHKITAKHDDFNSRVDTILLKSRQTGLSTIFQQLCVWHINFNRNVYDLVLSQTDREAIKFLNDLIGAYDEIPGPLRSKKLNANEHELWCSITGSKGKRSGVQALPPTTKAGRSYSPNLVILDEFAEYQHAEKVWTAISMSVSAGGIIVIIATPRGVGNLYHKIWEMTNKSLTVAMPALNKDKEDTSNAALSVFRPITVHWSQLPDAEFKRRGFQTSLTWYKHMCAKISMDKGEKAIAQELDLDFMASGNTIDANTLKVLQKNCIESVNQDIVVLDKEIPGLVIYEPPEKGEEYVIGIDTAEGVLNDYSSATIFKVPKDPLKAGILPTVVAYYSSNSQSVRKYTDIIKNTGLLYNEAWLNIERNNHGHVLLAYFIDDGDYNADKVFNKYDAVRAMFHKQTKGWNSQHASRTLLLATVLDFFATFKNDINVPLALADELKTFIQKPSGKWEAQSGYHDDNVISYALGLMAWKLLPRYKEFLLENSESWLGANITDDMIVGSSSLQQQEDNPLVDLIKKEKLFKTEVLKNKKDVDIQELRDSFNPDMVKEKREGPIRNDVSHRYLSRVVDFEDDDDIGVF